MRCRPTSRAASRARMPGASTAWMASRSKTVSDDFYCDEALSGRTPVQVVLETDDVLAFRHTRPFWPVHIVVVPKTHVPSLIDLGTTDEALLHNVLAVVRRVAEPVTRAHVACRVLT